MSRRFSKPVLSAIDGTKYLGLQAGVDGHRFIGIWVVVVDDRVFVRSWNDKPAGWFRAFLAEPRGTIQISTGREIRVRARKARGERLMKAIEAARNTIRLHRANTSSAFAARGGARRQPSSCRVRALDRPWRKRSAPARNARQQ
jgi:hypothetical protein